MKSTYQLLMYATQNIDDALKFSNFFLCTEFLNNEIFFFHLNLTHRLDDIHLSSSYKCEINALRGAIQQNL